MPYLPSSQDFLQQSSLLLEAYPESRITTKYTYPSAPSKQKQQHRRRQQNKQPAESAPVDPPAPPPATLTLKTYHPESGICLKYRTDKAAEIGRLVSGLGKLAAGVPVTEDTEMIDAPPPAPATPTQGPQPPPENTKQSGKAKKGRKR